MIPNCTQIRTIPRCLVDVEVSDGVLEVAHVSQAVCSERSELGKLVVRAEDLLDICSTCQESHLSDANPSQLTAARKAVGQNNLFSGSSRTVNDAPSQEVRVPSTSGPSE